MVMPLMVLSVARDAGCAPGFKLGSSTTRTILGFKQLLKIRVIRSLHWRAAVVRFVVTGCYECRGLQSRVQKTIAN